MIIKKIEIVVERVKVKKMVYKRDNKKLILQICHRNRKGYDEQLKRMLGEAHYKLANSLFLENNISRAISSYKNALSSNPNQLRAANKLSIILATTKNINYQKPKEALAVANRLCQITKNQNPDYLDTLSIAYAANNNYNSAKEASLKAIELWKKSKNEKRVNAALNRIKGFESRISEKQKK